MSTDRNNQNQRALFLDRDGVVNEEIGYLHRSEDVRWVPGIFSLCRTAVGLGYKLVVVTNQAGIARGYYTEDDFAVLMDWMCGELRREGVELDRVYYCPYHPEHGVGEYRREHEDRKPGTGMLERAARELEVSLAESVMVGDRWSDIEAANRAGLRQAFLVRGTETGEWSGSGSEPGEYIAVAGLDEVERWLVEQG